MELTIFSVNGQTMIGNVITSASELDSAANGTLSKVYPAGAVPKVNGGEYVFVHGPAAINFTIDDSNPSDAKLKWDIIPLMPAGLMQPNCTARNVFMFHKNTVALSGISAETDLLKKIVNAYKELV